MDLNNERKNWTFKLGLFLIGFSIIFFLLIALIPFLRLENKTKITLSTISLIIGEVTFWSGGILVGKKVFTRYKSYLNPLNWIKRKSKPDG